MNDGGEMKQRSAAPVAKVKAATVGAPAGYLLAYVLTWALREAGADVPEGIEFALEALLTSGLAFLAGYLTPPAQQDAPVPD